MRNILRITILALLSLVTSKAIAQDIIMGSAPMDNATQEEVRYFYDPGGDADPNNADNPLGNFDTNLVVTMTLEHSMNPNYVLYVYFDEFALGFNDTLWIYDGPDVNSDLIGWYNLVNNPGEIYSTNSALTFVFKSDNVSEEGLSLGWVARVVAYKKVTDEFRFTDANQGVNFTCNATFTDSGGENGNIANNSENTNGIMSVAFHSPAETHIKCEFTQFAVNGIMKIYDGQYFPGFPDYDPDNPLSNGRLIGQFTTNTLGGSSNMPPVLFSSTHQLTFVYIGASGDKNKAGWVAKISCVPELYEGSLGTPCPEIVNSPAGAYADEEGDPHVINFDCSRPVVLLEARVEATGSYSNDYTISRISEAKIENGGARMFEYNQGTPFVLTSSNADDIWIAESQLPFKFSFFGQMYQKVYPGANGLMAFDYHQPQQPATCTFSYDAPSTLSSTQTSYSSTPYVYKNCIYGVYEDIDPNNQHCPHNNAIRYGIVGSSPCRAFVFNYDNMGLYGVAGQGNVNNYNTYQMVFYEGTNIIDIFIKKRRCCASTNGGLNTSSTPANAEKEGVVGLQNKTSSQILIAPGRGMTAWEVMPENAEGWRFTPITPLDEFGELTWYENVVDDDHIIFHDPKVKNKINRITVSPTETTKYISKYTFTNAAEDEITVYDTTLIKVEIPSITLSRSSGNENICPGENVQVTVTPNTSDYPSITPASYKWSSGDTTQTATVAPQVTTDYTVTVTYNNGCKKSGVVKVDVTELELPKITATDTVLCKGESTTLTATHSTSNSFKWSNGSTAQSITVAPEVSTIYQVTATMEGSCEVKDTLLITVFPLPVPMFSATPTEILVENGIGTVNCNDLSQNDYSLTWNFGDYESSVNIVQDVSSVTHDYTRAGFYTITLTAEDDNKCVDSVKARISVKVPYFFYIPNAFRPNSGGANERFAPKGEGVDPDHYSMQIYDRNGNIIFSTTNPYDYWDGRNKFGKMCPEGVYVYIIRLKDLNGANADEWREYTGSVTLLK